MFAAKTTSEVNSLESPKSADTQTAPASPELRSIPYHVGIIMDGNGRWAQSRGLPRLAGHQRGVDNIRRILESCVELGIKVLTIYAFSTENWHRPQEEVSGLMRLLGLT
ncbi:MAG: di-trans,poly-cis-decaprenylcistransferase, partial [Caldilineaceae bacterium]|nr:di-trans,poly-cis-decaprenylcistransferase [Caldilineaceae bacterium]